MPTVNSSPFQSGVVFAFRKPSRGLGQHEAARRDIRLALDGFEVSRNQVGSRYLSQSFFASRRDSFDLAIQILMSERNKAAGGAQPTVEAWSIAEQARAQTMMDAIRSAAKLDTAPLSADALEKRAVLERDVAATEKNIFQLSASAGSASWASRIASARCLRSPAAMECFPATIRSTQPTRQCITSRSVETPLRSCNGRLRHVTEFVTDYKVRRFTWLGAQSETIRF